MTSDYYESSVRLGAQFQNNNPKNWTGYDVVKYHKQIKDLVVRYHAKTILDYGCGKGLQYTDPLPYKSEEIRQTFDQYLGATVYKYDPCVPEFATPPPVGTKFDGVICTQVLQSIPDSDLWWVREKLESYTQDFCFIGLNFQRTAKSKKHIYNKEHFVLPRTREFFKSYFTNWSNGHLFWWFKDRMHYDEWSKDQLVQAWSDVPDIWTGKYQFVETIY